MTGGADRAAARHHRALLSAFALILAVVAVEATAAALTRSLALISDAGHLLTDVLGLGMTLAAIRAAGTGRRGQHLTFGLYRLEILAALANAALLVGVAGFVLYEAASRLRTPPDVPWQPMLLVGLLALAANVVAFVMLHAGAEESLNVRAAYLEVLADMLGSAGVVAAAVVLATLGWRSVDAVVGVAIGLWILPRSVRLGAQALRILVEAAPPGMDTRALAHDLAQLGGVVDVHDVHVWTLTSGMEMASAHLMVRTGTDAHAVLDRARDVLRDRYHVAHATLQIEPDDHRGCDELSW